MMDAGLNWLYLPKQNSLCFREISTYSYEHIDRPKYIDDNYYTMNASNTELVPMGSKTYREGKEPLKKLGYRGLTCIQNTGNGDIRTGKTYKQMMAYLSK